MARRKIIYSRHARRRMRLYDIIGEDIEKAIANPDKAPEKEGNRFVIFYTQKEKFKGMPLKVIYAIEENSIVILSAYPLKKSYRR